MNAPTIAFFLEAAFSPWVSFLGPERLQFASSKRFIWNLARLYRLRNAADFPRFDKGNHTR
jgi:hypothetical protein